MVNIKGKVIADIKLMIAVNDIDNAMSPRAYAVKMFEVTPPGAAERTIIPKANSVGIFPTVTIAKATRGSIKICIMAPKKEVFGLL